MKKQKRNNEDNRGIAIYARKSRITNKGDSIGVQFKQCAEYAKRELQLDNDYSFMAVSYTHLRKIGLAYEKFSGENLGFSNKKII